MKIYINNIPIVLTDTPTSAQPNQDKSILQVSYRTRHELRKLIKHIEGNSQSLKQVNIIGSDMQVLREDFFSHYCLIDAAGGLVSNTEGHFLLIYRNGKWDLPKGKVEKNEAITDAAIREVEEETGIQQLSLKAPLILPANDLHVTYHTYFTTKLGSILKTTYWFHMHSAADDQVLHPQIEEGITKVAWVAPDKLDSCLKNTYLSIEDVIRAGRLQLHNN